MKLNLKLGPLGRYVLMAIVLVLLVGTLLLVSAATQPAQAQTTCTSSLAQEDLLVVLEVACDEDDTITIDWGDGETETSTVSPGAQNLFPHGYGLCGNYDIVVTDSSSTVVAEENASFECPPPMVCDELVVVTDVVETTATLSGCDNTETETVSWDWGDGIVESVFVDAGQALTRTHTYGCGQESYAIEVVHNDAIVASGTATVDCSGGGIPECDMSIVVDANVATVDDIECQNGEEFSATIRWGDGSSTSVVVDSSLEPINHTYSCGVGVVEIELLTLDNDLVDREVIEVVCVTLPDVDFSASVLLNWATFTVESNESETLDLRIDTGEGGQLLEVNALPQDTTIVNHSYPCNNDNRNLTSRLLTSAGEEIATAEIFVEECTNDYLPLLVRD